MPAKRKRTIKPKFLACIWCGGDIPKDKPYAMYCSKKCIDEAMGRYIKKGKS
jgi:ribosomal protein S26